MYKLSNQLNNPNNIKLPTGKERTLIFGILVILAMIGMVFASSSQIATFGNLALESNDQSLFPAAGASGLTTHVVSLDNSVEARAAVDAIQTHVNWNEISVRTLDELKALSSLDNVILIVVGHGFDEGLKIGNEIHSWETIAKIYDTFQADTILNIACNSVAVEELTTIVQTWGMKGVIDATLGGLNAAAAVAFLSRDMNLMSLYLEEMAERQEEIDNGAEQQLLGWVPTAFRVGNKYLWLYYSSSRVTIASSYYISWIASCWYYRGQCYPILTTPPMYGETGVSSSSFLLRSYSSATLTYYGNSILNGGYRLLNWKTDIQSHQEGSGYKADFANNALMIFAMSIAFGQLTTLNIPGIAWIYMQIINAAIKTAVKLISQFGISALSEDLASTILTPLNLGSWGTKLTAVSMILE